MKAQHVNRLWMAGLLAFGAIQTAASYTAGPITGPVYYQASGD